MYRLKINGSEYTIPKKNIRLLAIERAYELRQRVQLDTDEQAIAYLESIGITVLDK